MNEAVATVEWIEEEKELNPYIVFPDGTRQRAGWAAQEGSQRAFLECLAFEVLYEGTRGPGKGLPLDEPVYTPLGPVPIGSLRVGHSVLCPDGTKSVVVGVFPQGKRRVFELIFDDGAVSRCDDVHLWPIHVQGQRTKKKQYSYRVLPMGQVLKKFLAGQRLHIPTLDHLSLQNSPRLEKFPVEPYLLGLLLGDGCFTQGRVLYCTADDQLADVALRAGFVESPPDRRNGLRGFNGSHLKPAIASLGLSCTDSNTKFVPDLYLNARSDVRLSLLQGLLDTDGTVDKRGYVSFGSNSRRLAEAVQYLARSLGAKATLSVRKRAYIVYIQAANKFQPFRLKRKVARVRGYQHVQLWRRLVEIRELPMQETVCIKIDHPLGLFVTRDFVVTHNTDALLMSFAQYCGRGWGKEWSGLLFRQTYPQLADVIKKSKKWFYVLFPGIKYNEANHTWTWPTGETLQFRYGRLEKDYWEYHGHCVDEGEVLTAQGWQDIREVTVGTSVLSADRQGVLSWKPVVSVTAEQYDGELVQYEGRDRYMSFTPQHKLPTVDGLIPYEELPRCAEIQVAGWSWEGMEIPTFEIPFVPRSRPGLEDTHPRIVSGDDFCEFMGWWLSEGHECKGRIGIGQEKPEGRRKIQNLLHRMGMHYHATVQGFEWKSKSWSRYLRQFGKCRDKYVPTVIKQASRRQLEKFFTAYVDGDGTRQGERVYIYTISRRMADDLCEIAVKLGYSAHVSSKQRKNRRGLSYTVACNPKPLLRLYTDNRQRTIIKLSHHTQVQRIQYKGMVYCLAVPDNHTFFLRQRGSVWLSGNSWPWIGFEELTTWADPGFYKKMMSCCRSTKANMPRMFRSTTNPYGPGHNWVKLRFKLPLAPGRIIGPLFENEKDERGNKLPERMAIHGYLDENRILMTADPEYKSRLSAAARNKAELLAWLDGSWDIVAGGMFDDVWEPKRHVLPRFAIPSSWRVDRSFDWGSSHPFSVGWWAESDGSDLVLPDGRVCSTVRGDLFRIGEWYGWTGEPNKGLKLTAVEIAKGIVERELNMGIHNRCKPGPADAAIFKTENGMCIATDLMAPVIVNGSKYRVMFVSSNSAPGTRKPGWELMRRRLKAVLPDENRRGPREFPGLFICDSCDQWLRTVPVAPRDDKDLDNLDTEVEDHSADETRYRVMASNFKCGTGRTTGGAS